MAVGTRDLFRVKSVELILREEASKRSGTQLRRTLGVWDLTFLGIAAIIGAGIFSTIGNAAADGGPAVVFLFVLTAIACAFSAFCYAEFASAIPIAGSAYTYAYASFGELFAWIIGWDLICEYAIGNIAVAISWSDYFVSMLANFGVHVPVYLTLDYLSASRGYDQVAGLLAQGKTLEQLASDANVATGTLNGYQAWLQAPHLASIPIIANIPALLITVIITAVVYWGIQESKVMNNVLVVIKLAVVLLVIALGTFYIHPANWVPFAPHGVTGVMKGVSAVFFAYIGFDAISTTAEECRNPQRDLPRGMIYSLVICTVLYIVISLVLTGMVPSSRLAVGDPLAYVFGPQGANLPWISTLISVSAVIALSTVLLVFQLGQPRIWMSMSRDGLLPGIFSSIHPRHQTPWFSTILTGIVVGVPALFVNLTEMTDLTSIGTLFAFVLVCGGVLRLPQGPESPGNKDARRTFRIFYINSKYIFPVLVLLSLAACWVLNRDGVRTFFDPADPTGFQHKIPLAVFLVGLAALTVTTYRRSLSLIPVLGLASCAYLMTELGIVNWIRFGAWLVVGLVLYFCYGIRNSRLRHMRAG